MSKTVEIKCDACGDDLTYTGNGEDYRLVVGYERLLPWYVKEGQRGGFVTAMAVEPPVDRTYHFCDLNCMDVWRDAQRAKDARRKRWYDEHRKEIAPGMSTIEGHCPPDDELARIYG